MKIKASILLLILSIFTAAQTGSININVFDEFTKKPLPANIKISKINQEFSGIGNIIINDLPSGTYNLEVESETYEMGFLNELIIKVLTLWRILFLNWSFFSWRSW